MKRVVIDIEANSLIAPTKIWLVVCKDIDTNELYIFRNLHEENKEHPQFSKGKDFLDFARSVTLWIGHNCLDYDFPVLRDVIQYPIPDVGIIRDTIILSRLVNYPRATGHSLESYGVEFGLVKLKHNYSGFFGQWSQALEDYCVRDVEICARVYHLFSRIIHDPAWDSAIDLEHRFQLVVNDLHRNGFAFNTTRANVLLGQVVRELGRLDDRMQIAFPPKETLIREFTPKLTKFGTISRTSVPRQLHANIHAYEAGQTYRHTRLVPFNPDSHKQRIEVLNAAGWKPEDKTQAHIDCEREINRNKKTGIADDLSAKLAKFKVSGWKINETNLGTLPFEAPEPARLLAQRILYESRRRSLTEWLGLISDDGRIHGKFVGMGAWTHRMAHQQPNTANIPKEFNIGGSKKLLGKELRELWIAPKGRLLVGVDAEGIQLRIFAHYIDDKEFTNALVNGRKSDKSDPHSLNQRILGPVCKTRDAAKRFVYALLLGAGIGKLAQILETSRDEASAALDHLMERYQGFRYLKKNIIPRDGRRGYFIGIDERRVPIPGESSSERSHLCMSGYLQNGEAIIIKRAAIHIDEKLQSYKPERWAFVNIVHDELQSEVKNSIDFAIKVAKIKAEAIREAGEYYSLKCPMAGSYWNDEAKDYTIGNTWYKTH